MALKKKGETAKAKAPSKKSRAAASNNGSGLSAEEVQKRIQDRAYFLSLDPDRAGCSAEQNWQQAESDVKGQLGI